jgi:transcriptional regulator with XRE-family HTH domain
MAASRGSGGEGSEDRFSRRVKFERESRGLSQADLAKLLSEKGLRAHPTTIAKIESRDTDRPRSIRLDEAVALAEVFGTSVDELLGQVRTFDRRAAVDRVVKVAADAMRGIAHALDPLEQAIEALKINPTDLRRHADLLEQDMLALPDDDAALIRAILMVREYVEVGSRMRLVADSINVMAGYASQSADKVIRTLNDLMESNPDASKT